MRRLLLISNDMEFERHLGAALSDICAVTRVQNKPHTIRWAADEGINLIAIDGDIMQGDGSFIADVVTETRHILPIQPIIVLGDETDPFTMLRAVRAGARDVIGRSETVINLRAQIARHFMPLPGTGQSELHVVLHSLPGAGCLHAVNLAVLRARSMGDGLLIDCTLPQSQVSTALDLRLGYTVADALQDTERLDRMLLNSVLAFHSESALRILPLATDPDCPVDHLSPDRIIGLVSQLRGFFPEVVVDAGGVRHAGMLRGLAEQATAIHLVTPQTINAVQGARGLIELLGDDLVERMVLVVDDHDPDILLTSAQMANTLGMSRTVVIPSAHAAMANALNAGEPMVLAEPASPYTAAMAGLAGLEPEHPQHSFASRLARLAGRLR